MANADDFNTQARAMAPAVTTCPLSAEDENSIRNQNREMRDALERQLAMAKEGALNTAPYPASGSDTEHLARTVAALTLELEHLLHHTGLLGSAVASLMDAKAQFSEEDVELIKAHVRHPGALEAARLRETIRCALVALKAGAVSAAQDILEELDAKG